MKQNVWVVELSWVHDTFERDNEVFLCATRELAIKKFKEIVADEKKLQRDNGINLNRKTAGIVIEKSETSFSWYRDGHYNNDHYTVSVSEKEIEGNFVSIPLGKLTAEHSRDPDYPAISIYLEEEMVAAVQYEEEKGLRIFAYADMTDEEPTILPVENIEEQLAKHKET